MRKYLAATLLVAAAIGLALAIDAGAGVGVGAGKNGASAGVSGRKGTRAGAAVGTNGGRSIGARSSVGPTSHGKSSGGGLGAGSSSGERAVTRSGGASSSSAAGPASLGTGAASTIVGSPPATGLRQAVVLPRILWPLKALRGEYERGELLRFPAPTAVIPGTPHAVVRVCTEAIASAASPLGAVRVRAASAGPLNRGRRGAITAPLAVRID